MGLTGEQRPGFDEEKHARYVSLGYCAEVHWSQTYCCLLDGHQGRHAAVRLTPDGMLEMSALWD